MLSVHYYSNVLLFDYTQYMLTQLSNLLQIDLISKFEMTNNCRTVSIGSMTLDHRYPILCSERINTKFWPSVVMTLGDSTETVLKAFLPKRYSNIIQNEDMIDLNNSAVSLNLVYKGKCEKTKSYIIQLEV
jgi:hypothetical protein